MAKPKNKSSIHKPDKTKHVIQDGKGKKKEDVKSAGRSESSTRLLKLAAALSFLAGIMTSPLLEMYGPETGLAQRSLTSKLSSDYACDEETLSHYLHNFEVPGMHVVCLEQDSITFYKDAMSVDSPRTLIGSDLHEWATLRGILSSELDLRSTDKLHQPWATFSPTGARLLDEADPGESALDAYRKLGLFLVFQGGQWIWPGVRKGYKRHIRLDETSNSTLETLSLHPLVLSVQGFLSERECDWIKEEAAPNMRYSQVTLMDKDKGRPASDFRTSQTTFLQASSPELKDINGRTASLVRIPVTHQEHAQVLQYNHLEKYDSHHDYFDPTLYKQDERTLNLIQKGRRNRMATVFWYLSDVEEGGETVFPRMDKAPPGNPKSCEVGLRVKPERGKVIIFYSMTPDGDLDPYSLHGACPVKEGVKWAANKWVWNAPQSFVKA